MKLFTLPKIPRTSPPVRFKNILLATDLGAASVQAHAYAVLLARALGSHLYILYTEPGPGLSPRYLGAGQALKEEAAKPGTHEVQALEKYFKVSGAPFTLLLKRGEVGDTLDRVMEDHPIDLIVVGSHGRKGISHLFMGSTAEDVTRSVNCPVITVGPQAFLNSENPFKTIVFATDFSEESKLALPYATFLAQEFNANLTVLNVAPKHERLAGEGQRVKDYLLNQLKNLVPQARFPWCSISYVVTFGDAAREIPKTARGSNADLIVLGLHSAVQFTSHLPERLAYRVLCEASCPVLSLLPGARELKLARIPGEFLSMVQHMN